MHRQTQIRRQPQQDQQAAPQKRQRRPGGRVGAKGRGEFVEATWDEALEAIASKLNEIRRSSDGPQAISQAQLVAIVRDVGGLQ